MEWPNDRNGWAVTQEKKTRKKKTGIIKKEKKRRTQREMGARIN
jgi:hypothetical protein